MWRNLRSLLAISFLVGMAVGAATAARTIYVDDESPADFSTIQAAIDDANDGDVIVVNPGRYTGDGNRDIDFGGKAITVCSTDPDDPNIVAATVIDCQGTEGEPHRGFRFHNGEELDSIVAGLTVTNGHGPWDGGTAGLIRSVGGAIFCEGSGPRISKCLIAGNHADSYGGGISCHNSSPVITHCTISHNSAKWAGGGLDCRRSSPMIRNCIIAGNYASRGAGVYCSLYDSSNMSNCTIVGNSSGGVECGGTFEASPTITRCIIWGNGNEIVLASGHAPSRLAISYSNVSGGQAATRIEPQCRLDWGEGNIDADPCFADANNGDYHLLWNSPCINAGNPDYVPEPNQSDMDGQPRVINSRIDMGADEFNWTGPIVNISPRMFDFLAEEDRQSPEPQILSILDVGGEVLNWAVSHSCDWLETDFSAGSLLPSETNEVTLNVDVAGLGAGDYNCELTVSDPNALNSPQTAQLNLRIVGPAIAISAKEFEFSAIEAGPNPEGQVLTIQNNGGGTLKWEILKDCDWLEVNPNMGSSTGEIDEVTVALDIAGLELGIYDCELIVSDQRATHSPQIVSVTMYVIRSNGDNELLVPSEYPTIQLAIDCAWNEAAVIVADGTYTGERNRRNRQIDFKGKAITVRSEGGPENCIIDCGNSGSGFYFQSGEDANSIINGFTITNASGGGVYCRKSSPTISNCIISNSGGGGISCGDSSCPTITNCTIIGNTASVGGGIACWDGSNTTIDNCAIIGNLGVDAAGGIWCKDSNVTLTRCTVIGNVGWQSGGGVSCQEATLKAANCTFAGNSARKGDFLACVFVHDHRSYVYVSNCIIRNGGDEIWNGTESAITIAYSDVEGGWPGEGNIDAEPCSAAPGYWEPYEPNRGPPSLVDYFWVEGDYHLKSQAGRWDPSSQTWVKDDVTSPCIDAGDPVNPIGLERFPNGGIINMGAYGGTAEASKSYFGEPVCETIVAGDINGDCRVNFRDFQLMAFHWLENH